MSGIEVSRAIFNEIMKKALEERKQNPEKPTITVAEESCEPVSHFFKNDKESYDDLVFQVTMNLVNANR
jgi:hypothetical protein